MMIHQLNLPIHISEKQLEVICQRWHIRELAVFGSILHGNFTPESDIDLLLSFDEDAQIGFRELAGVEDDLGALFGRQVDISTRAAIEASQNWIIRREILDHAEVLYARS